MGPVWVRKTGRASSGADNISAEAGQPLVEMDVPASLPETAVETGMASEALSLPAGEMLGDAPPAADIERMDWTAIKAAVAGCVKCRLCHGRTKTVFGVGDEKAKWLFVGEGPGRNEDQTGEPFVGPAGKLLDNMLLPLGVKRGENAYIANIVKCRPTDASGKDRPPTPEEAAACMPYLQRQIALIKPTIIVALGKTAALSLLGLDPETPVSSLRGKVHRYQNLPLVVTYHPAYLLRNTVDKKKAWMDLCLAMSTYAESA
ncbi:uracil-DNA glycosylase [Noviherbaspirillum massiliense]|uniref:uracil-DNA glycosylase n=1 Tax=Noviherbaspirillum massiliense TaxID=1465823 RepID=UPI001FE22978|nr:uracil-DNA glycosylase [Noviherbaspirillum massiliense]